MTESTTPAVSVLLSARNAEGTVEEAVRSILRGRFRDFEVVACDDGSEDGTGEVLKKMAAEDSRVRVFRLEGDGNIAQATMAMWPECQASLVARMDADDIAHEERLVAQMAMLEKRPELAGVGCLVDAPGAGKGMTRFVDWSNRLLEPEELARERFVESPLVQPAMLLRRSAVEEAGGYLDPLWAEDYDLWLRMFERGASFAKVPEVLMSWPDSETRLTRSHERYSQENFLRAKAHYLARLEWSMHYGVEICGAGPIGKKLGRFLLEEGCEVKAFYEVNVRRVGEVIGGITVLGHEQFGRDFSGVRPLLVGAVGVPGGRERLRRVAEEANYREGEDFFCAA